MTTEQKIIRAKIGRAAKQLGNVSQACKMMGYGRDPDCGSAKSAFARI
jgi:hypothetical protein